MRLRPRRGVSQLMLAIAVLGATHAILPAQRVAACSCVGPGLAENIASGEIVFVGTVTGESESRGGFDWRFSVVENIRGEVPAEVVVHGDDYRGGCGPDFGSPDGPIVVVAGRDDGRYEASDCTPVASAKDLDKLLAPLPRPDGHGPVAALVAHPYRWSNIAALDRAGRVLSWGFIDGGVSAVAHCRGSSTAAATTWTEQAGQRLRFVDLNTMEVTDGGEVGVPVDSHGDLECVGAPGRFDVVSTAAYPQSADFGRVRVAVSGTRAESMSVDDASDGVILSDGSVFVLPGRAGGSISLVGGEPLAAIEKGALTDREAAVVGAVNAAETKLAMVISVDGKGATDGVRPKAIAIFEIGSDRSLVRTTTLLLRDSRAVEAGALAWLDDETLAVERSTGNTKVLDVYGTDGSLVSRTDIGWGWGDAVVGGKLLRSRHDGLELIAPDGTSTPLTPPPGSRDAGGESFVRAVDDGPVIDPQRPSPPQRRPVVGAGPSVEGDDTTSPALARFGDASPDATTTISVIVVLAALAIVGSFVRRRRTEP